MHTWSVTYGGFNFSTDVTMVSVGTTVKLGSALQDTNVGIDLFYVIPVEVTYQWGNVHFLAGTGVAIPVSSYDPWRGSAWPKTKAPFCYASIEAKGERDPPFAFVQDAYGGGERAEGNRRGKVSGSFFHVIAADERNGMGPRSIQ